MVARESLSALTLPLRWQIYLNTDLVKTNLNIVHFGMLSGIFRACRRSKKTDTLSAAPFLHLPRPFFLLPISRQHPGRSHAPIRGASDPDTIRGIGRG